VLSFWRRYHHSIWSGPFLMIRTVAGFGAQKVVAIFYGPAGTTLFSHFQNLVALFTQPIQDAVANGIINAFPKKSLRKAQVIGGAIILLVSLVVLSGILLLISSQFKQRVFTFSFYQWSLIVISILLFCFGLIVGAVYVIQQKLKQYSVILFFQWALFFSCVVLVDLSLNQFLIFWVMIQSIFSVVLIFPIYGELKPRFRIDREVVNHFKQFLLMALTIWLSSKWVDYYIREFAIQEFGTVQTGLWQSVVRVSEAYRGLIISFLFLSFYPKLSHILASRDLNLSTLRKFYSQYMLFGVLFLFLVYQFDDFILQNLYSDEYVEAANLFQFQILGDLFAFLSFPFSIYLIASVRTKAYIFTELFSAFMFVSLILLNRDLGIEILVYAHIIRFICYFASVLLISIKRLKYVR